MAQTTRTRVAPWKLLLVTVAAILIGSGLGLTSFLITPVTYVAQGSLILAASSGDQDRYIATQIAIATGENVIGQIASVVGQPSSVVSEELRVAQVRLSNVVNFSATTSSAPLSLELAKAAQDAYMDSPVLQQQRAPNSGTVIILQRPVSTERAGLNIFEQIGIGALTGLMVGLIASFISTQSRSGRQEPIVTA